ncbi:MAG TPA: triple tyrosine motif-containing protein [Saprospiraceae bacterium]|mgnify:CR=1 FL=1|nr:triple tyrosine motif-containing protein [Saprospiraceae bacterium]HMQ83171.1 triple tyrosine motif-containing protein [Saprospiraceae bacterium]
MKHVDPYALYRLCFGLLCLIGTKSIGQDLHFSFHHLSPNEGLSQGTNAFIYQDSRGFIWLSSLEGLNRFDGKSVKIYKADGATGLLGNIITSNFYEDEAANLWFTTYEGIHCYIRKKDRFEHYQLQTQAGATIVQDYFAFYLDKADKLWLRAGVNELGVLHVWNTQTRKDSIIGPIGGQRHYPVCEANGQVSQIVSAYFTNKAGIELLDLSTNRTVSLMAEDKPALAARRSFVALPDLDSLWYLAMDNALIAFNPWNQTAQVHEQYRDQPIGEVRAMAHLNDSLLLVATAEAGLLLFHTHKQKFIQHIPLQSDRPNGLHFKNIIALYVDKQENLWVSSPRGGVSYTNLKKQKFENITPLQGLAITAMFEDKQGAVWCNARSGEALRFSADGKSHQIFPLLSPKDISAGKVEYFFEDPLGGIWACYTNALFRWNADLGVFQYQAALPSDVLYVYRLKNGRILVTTYAGIYAFLPLSGQFEKVKELGEWQVRQSTAVYEDKNGKLYLALDATSLIVLEKKAGFYRQKGSIENIGYARAFYEKSDTLWVATTTGLLYVNTSNLNYQRLNESEHLVPAENYYSILPDQANCFWLSCNRGVIRYDPFGKTYRRYSPMDGLQDNEFNKNAYLLQSNGRMWMGGNKGLNRFDPLHMPDVPYLPSVRLTQLLINDEPYDKYERRDTNLQVGELKQITLPFLDNTLSLEFVALEYSDPANNTFEYQLEPYDNGWVKAGTKGFVRYANLPPNYYTFRVKAANSDGRWNETPLELLIHVKTPWWRTWWFYALCLVTIASITYGIFVYQLQQALKIERMRVKISSNLHDDVGTILSGLAMQSEILELSAPESNKPKLKRISELSRSAMSRMRDTVWAIDARKDKLENLIDRMREHAEETLTPKDIFLDLQVDQLALSKSVPSHIRQNLYLIYKEAITNVAKHSNADRVTVRLHKTGKNGLSMRIQDNGRVVEKNYKTTGLGLSNMQLRAEQMGASFQTGYLDGFFIEVVLLKGN